MKLTRRRFTQDLLAAIAAPLAAVKSAFGGNRVVLDNTAWTRIGDNEPQPGVWYEVTADYTSTTDGLVMVRQQVKRADDGTVVHDTTSIHNP